MARKRNNLLSFKLAQSTDKQNSKRKSAKNVEVSS